jgi:hypothetical protein
VQLAVDAGVELWHDSDDEGFATIMVNGHREHWPVRSRVFRTWLQRAFYEKKETVANAQATSDALSVLDGKARFDGAEHRVFVRVAEHEGAVFLDLADDEWRCVRVTGDGWKACDDAPVRFKRRDGMLPIPRPERDGDLSELRQFVNVTDEHWPLAIGWELGALHPRGPYPVLDLSAEHGTAKSTTARVLRRLIDPNSADVRGEPRESRDLAIAARNSWVVAFDNLSSLRPGLSDDLARLSTGAGFATRRLYENDEEMIFNSCRPVIVNGIEDVVTRPDLLDRALLLRPPRISDKNRVDESTFWARFDEARGRILGALLDATAMALKRYDETRLDSAPRMADFARWVVAGEAALGLPEGTFLPAYEQNRAQASGLALEADPVAQAIVAMVSRRGEWTGTSGELASLLLPSDRTPKDWPASGQQMVGALRRAGPVLRAHGLNVEYDSDARPRTWTLLKTPVSREGEETSGETDEVTERSSDQPERPATLSESADPGKGESDGTEASRHSPEADCGQSDARKRAPDQHFVSPVTSVTRFPPFSDDEPGGDEFRVDEDDFRLSGDLGAGCSDDDVREVAESLADPPTEGEETS